MYSWLVAVPGVVEGALLSIIRHENVNHMSVCTEVLARGIGIVAIVYCTSNMLFPCFRRLIRY
jgi:uncharacterized membrane protein